MDEIGKIVFNSLVSRRPVYLPCVGTFRTEYIPAKDRGDGTVIPPVNTVAFFEGQVEGAVPVTDMIPQQPGGESPSTQYDRWLVKATERGPVVIEGIGVVNSGVFTPYETLMNALNPIPGSYTAAVKAAGRKGLGKSEKVWIALIAVFILVLAGGWTWWYKYYSQPTGHNKWNTHNPAATDNLDNIPEAAGTVGTESYPEENDAAAEITETTALPASADPAPVPVQTAPATGTGYYVVGGVFSTQENADKYVREMKAKYSSLDYVQHPYKGGKILVSLGSSTDRAEANRERRRIEETIREFDLWLYEIK